MKKFILFSFILSSLIAGQSEAASTPQVWWVDLKNGNEFVKTKNVTTENINDKKSNKKVNHLFTVG